jgi:hypothetical protein
MEKNTFRTTETRDVSALSVGATRCSVDRAPQGDDTPTPFDHKIHLQIKFSRKSRPCFNLHPKKIISLESTHPALQEISRKRLTPSREILLEEQDLPGIVLLEGQSPAMIFLPP